MENRTNIFFWIIISLLLLIIFGSTSGNFIYTFYFLVFFIPVLILTAWVFNNILIPRFLLKKKYPAFILYSVATMIISLDVELVLVFIAFLLMSYYDFENMSTIIDHYKWMPVVIYFVVLLSGFIALAQLILRKPAPLVDSGKMSILIRSERKNRNILFNDILYIESMSDYVRFILLEGEKVITREKISHLSERLPAHFIRIHRSYIVNRNLLTSFNREQVITGGKELPVSRTYRKEAIEKLENQNTD